MDLLHLVDRLEELVGGARRLPISNKLLLDQQVLLELIDQIRVAIPKEVKEATEITAQRERIFMDAQEESRIMIARAEQTSSHLISEHTIAESARKRAQEIADEAEKRLRERVDHANAEIQQRITDSRQVAQSQMDDADGYSLELLRRLEKQLNLYAHSIGRAIQQLDVNHEVKDVNHTEDTPLSLDAESNQESKFTDNSNQILNNEDVDLEHLAIQEKSHSNVDEDEPADAGESTDEDEPADKDEPADEDETIDEDEPLVNLLNEVSDEVIDDFDNKPLDDEPAKNN